MLHLTLYKYADAIKRVNKTVQLVGGTAMTGDEVMPNQSLLDLSVIISSTTAPQYNYCHIQEFNRYYFINNISWLGGSGYQLDLHVDVLQTYYSKFLSMNALIEYSSLGSALEYDPRMNYVDQAVVTRSAGAQYPQFILDATAQNVYSQSPMVMLRYYQLPAHTTVQDGDHNDETTVECAFMSQAAFNQFIHYYNSLLTTEAERVDFGSKIIDVTNVYYINEYRLSQATTRQQSITIRTPKKPDGNTISIADAGALYIYVINSPAKVGAMGSAYVTGANITAANNWTLAGTYTTRLPYIGDITITPAKMGINTVKQLYYVIAIDPYAGQYVVIPTDAIDGTGNWYYEQRQLIDIRTFNAFPVDLSVDNAELRKMQIVMNGTTSIMQGLMNGAGFIPMASKAIESYDKYTSMDAAEAAHYKYLGGFIGSPTWTPADTRRIIQTVTTVPPDTNSAAYWSAYGMPDHEMRYLSALTGYAKIEQIHMRYMDTATKEEIDELETLLKGGVIF